MDGAISISYNFVPSYKLDTTAASSVAAFNESSSIPSPWLQIQAQYGLLEHLDVGGSFGVGLYSIGLKAYSKFSLLPKDNKLGISLYAQGGWSGSNDKVEDASVNLFNGTFSIPISYQFTTKSALVFQPIFSTNKYALHIENEDQTYKDNLTDQVNKIGLGYIRTNLEKDSKIHYNIAIGYSERTGKILPTLGIAITP